jgi:hypothetical protein
VAVVALARSIPFLPHAALLGFEPLPDRLMATPIGIALLYAGSAELLKAWFFRRVGPD